ncbi:MAG: ATP synthase F1 subunit delta [Bacteroidales bacterium]
MDRSLLSRRYALALYEYAQDRSQEQVVKEHMMMLLQAWGQLPDLKKALLSPSLGIQNQIRLLQLASGDEGGGELTRFFQLLARNNRLTLAGRIARSFLELWDEKHHIVNARLYTVGEVNAKLRNELEELVRKAVPAQQVEFSYAYSPELIGGFILQVDDLRIDASVRNELKSIKLNLLK